MKKIIIMAAALSVASFTFAPLAASARPMQAHCKVIKDKVRIHGHWVVKARKVCR